MKSFWNSRFLTLLLLVADVIAMSLVWRAAWHVRDEFLFPSRPINPLSGYLRILPRLILVWIAGMAWFDHYRHRGRISSLNQTGNMIRVTIWFVIGTMTTAYLFKDFDIGRSVILLAAAGLGAWVHLSRTLLRRVKEAATARGIGLTRVAIIGSGESARRVAARIVRHPEVGYDLTGRISLDPGDEEDVEGVPVIGTGADLVETLLRHRVEEVFLAAPGLSQDERFNLVAACEDARVHFKIVASDLFQVITSRVKIDDIDDVPVIELRDARPGAGEAIFKRALDLCVAVPMLLLTLPAWLVIAILIRLDSAGSALFVHERVGLDGRRFTMFKFRTMSAETDPYAAAPAGADDERITRFGRFLRRTSLDELPQLLNVIRGEMSMVGPRPEMPFIVEGYEPWQRRRLHVPPGITGLWQIAGRKRLPLHGNLEYDFYYIRNRSPLLDLEILIRTVPAVLFGHGAY